MASERNALAELANELTWIEDVLRSERYGAFCDEANKAKRIIAELAKVSDGHWNDVCNGDPAYFCDASDLKVQCTIGRCRAIAEEGVKDVK